MSIRDRTEEIRLLWESAPSGTLEAGLSADPDTIMTVALECLHWVTDFKLKYKDEFRPLEGLDAIINNPTINKGHI